MPPCMWWRSQGLDLVLDLVLPSSKRGNMANFASRECLRISHRDHQCLSQLRGLCIVLRAEVHVLGTLAQVVSELGHRILMLIPASFRRRRNRA